MAEFIVNPRRAPRAPARCRTAVTCTNASFEAETEDIGAYGCQVVSPRGVKKGDAVRLTIANDRLAEPLVVPGRIAWVSAQFPWRVGIAFDDGAFPATSAWFERLVEAYPGMRTLRRLPETIPVEAVVYLGAPPRFVVDFSEDEAAILRAIGSGTRVDELVVRFRARHAVLERALFSLITRSAVTLSRGQAVHPSAWKPILDEVEALLAVESLGSGSSTLAAPPEAWTPRPAPAPVPVQLLPEPGPLPFDTEPRPARGAAPKPIVPPFERGEAVSRASPRSRFGTSPQDPSPVLDLADDGLRIEVEDPTLRGTPTRIPLRTAAPVSVQDDAKGTGWRKPAQSRSGEAQATFDRARAEFGSGNLNGAIALLRRALALAPGDPEIAGVLGKLAFRDRDPGSR